ncbi:winged helix-turn-helix transcriptional regulator [Foetidibacter luteolus]|uniref:winged helix-turn-helix transcriptional regulator n=1 Tax=Foetidibacter luteolus TaxID=2608880 RepID=UPI00129A8F06|nr:helix-turn-helix domain-containing protein [Foetidibacter luteolus]
MAKIKESSTQQSNKRQATLECPVSYVINKIGGRWKPLIIYHLLAGPRRYNELKKAIPPITEKMLIQHLKELETDKLITREAKQVVPPVVVYSLTVSGKALMPVIQAMGKWAALESNATPVDTYGLFS